LPALHLTANCDEKGRNIMKKHAFATILVLSVLILTGAGLLIVGQASSATNWNFTIPAEEVKPANGVFTFSDSLFVDGKAKHFLYKHSPSEWVRFFVVKSTDGVTRAAFDACDVCWRNKKGYTQQGNEMVCINCGMRFRTDKINEVRGGCNPAPLNRALKGGSLVITQGDVLQGLGFFK